MGTIRYDEARTHFSELLDQEKASRAWHQSLSLGSGTRGRCSHVEALNIARCPPEESIVGVVLVQVANVHPRVGGAFHQSRGRSRRSGAREARFRGSQAAHRPRTAELPHHPQCQREPDSAGRSWSRRCRRAAGVQLHDQRQPAPGHVVAGIADHRKGFAGLIRLRPWRRRTDGGQAFGIRQPSLGR